MMIILLLLLPTLLLGADQGPPIDWEKCGIWCGEKCKIGSKYYELETEPECSRNDEANDNTSRFFAKLPSGPEPIQAGDHCYKYYDCAIKSNLALPGAEDVKAGLGIDKSDPMVLKCANASKLLDVHNAEKDVHWNFTSSYVCDRDSGIFYNDSFLVPSGSSISCLDPPSELETEEDFLTDKVNVIIGGAFAGFLVLLGIAMTAAYLILTRKSKVKHLKRKDMDNMNNATLIKSITAQYGHALAANSANFQLITESLELLEILFYHKIEDLTVWAAARKFLLRFQMYIVKIDVGIWHMANRYLILQSTKIIEQRKWRGEKPPEQIAVHIDDDLDTAVEAYRFLQLKLYDVVDLVCCDVWSSITGPKTFGKMLKHQENFHKRLFSLKDENVSARCTEHPCPSYRSIKAILDHEADNWSFDENNRRVYTCRFLVTADCDEDDKKKTNSKKSTRRIVKKSDNKKKDVGKNTRKMVKRSVRKSTISRGKKCTQQKKNEAKSRVRTMSTKAQRNPKRN